MASKCCGHGPLKDALCWCSMATCHSPPVYMEDQQIPQQVGPIRNHLGGQLLRSNGRKGKLLSTSAAHRAFGLCDVPLFRSGGNCDNCVSQGVRSCRRNAHALTCSVCPHAYVGAHYGGGSELACVRTASLGRWPAPPLIHTQSMQAPAARWCT